MSHFDISKARNASFDPETDAQLMALPSTSYRSTYRSWQRWFEEALPPDMDTYRRYHGLIVLHGKQTCRPQPRCGDCCLLDLCRRGRSSERERRWSCRLPLRMLASRRR